MPWYAATASVTGLSHRKSSLPCQDFAAFDLDHSTQTMFGAVSDGAGSAPRSEVGAALAVDTALKLIKTESWRVMPDVADVQRAFARIQEEVLSVLNEKAKELNCPLEHLACTLLVFVATREWLAAMQIGDGILVVRNESGEYELLFKPDRGEYVNETTFVTSPATPEENHLQVGVWPHSPRFICGSTDGIERVCIRYQDWTPHPPFFSTLEKYMESRPDSLQGAKDIAEFLERGKLNDRTDDDKTLLLCCHLP